MHFSLYQTNFKARKRYLFFSLKRSLQKREKGTFSAVKNVPIKRAKKVPFLRLKAMFKEPLKINGVFKLYLKAVSNSTD